MPARGRWPRGRRKATYGKPAQKSDPEVGDLVGKIVHIPAEEYGINVPGMFYRARVVKKDPKHRSSVVVSFFEDDGSHNWIPAREVRRWLAATVDVTGTTNQHSDDYAIETLLQIRDFHPSKSSDDASDDTKQCKDKQVQAQCTAGELLEGHVASVKRHAVSTMRPQFEACGLKLKPLKVDAAVQTIPRGQLKLVLASGQPGCVGPYVGHPNSAREHVTHAGPLVGHHSDGDVEMEV